MKNESDGDSQHHILTRFVLSLLMLASVLNIQSSEAATGVNSAAAFAAANPVEGERVYMRCIGCHSLDRNRTGPKHCGLFGRKAGSVEGYQYSRAMSTYAIVWDQLSLDTFLRAPLRAVPGTTMGFAGIKDKQDRHNLIAYLEQASVSEVCDQQG